MTTSDSEPTEERRPTSDNFRALAIDELAFLMAGANYPVSKRLDMVNRFIARRDALLAAEPEHQPALNLPNREALLVIADVVSDAQYEVDQGTAEAIIVAVDILRALARPSLRDLLTGTDFEHWLGAAPEHLPVFHVGAVEMAHDLADLAGCRVIDDQTGEDA